MATEEQEAFIDEMMHKKPREIWQELWDARQRLAELTANVNPFGWRSTYKEPNYPEGDWMPLPVDGTDVPHEFMQDERGTCWIRPVKETGANPFWFVDLLGPERRGGLKYVDTAKAESLVKEEGSLKDIPITEEIRNFRESWVELKEGDAVTITEANPLRTYTTTVARVDEREDGLYVTFEDGTSFEPPIKFTEHFDIDYNGHVPEVEKTLTVKEVYENVRDNLTSIDGHKKKLKVPKIKPLKGGTDFNRD